ncbi:FMN-linked oxidoreductase [Peniophora sp. CONT]|nr:FMN-linked oxidoreductase [Peniophora sp. CONT]
MSSKATSAALFSPITVGRMQLNHRIVHPAATRCRAAPNNVATDLMAQYMSERAHPGAFVIGEATIVAERAGGFPFATPGIWRDDQVEGWKKVVDAVHAKGGYIYLQILAFGRMSMPMVLGSHPYVGASSIPQPGRPDSESRPRPLTVEEIKEYVADFAAAARRAVDGAGFDGVEIHAAHGFLIEQFLKTSSNDRTDQYGGSPENMARFALKVVDAVTEAIGEDRVGIRFSPWPTSMNTNIDDPTPVYLHLVQALASSHPKLSYIHFIEPRVDNEQPREVKAGETNDAFREAWGDRPFISAGGFTRESALELTEKRKNALVAFGRHYTSNPDLPERLRLDKPLTPYERSLFYAPGEKGYIGFKKWDQE